MIETSIGEGESETVVLVRANQSLSWRGNVWVALAIGALSTALALVLALQGFWLVLPFAGAETVFLIGCFYWVLRRLSVREVITVGPDRIVVEWGRLKPERAVELPRSWASLYYDLPDSPFENGSLELRSHGRRIALGAALGRDEKRQLHKILLKVLG